MQDTLKVIAYKVLFRFDIFQICSQAEGKGRRPGDEHLLGIEVRLSLSSSTVSPCHDTGFDTHKKLIMDHGWR